MAVTFKAARSDITIHSEFSQPAFTLLSDALGLQKRLFEALSRYGVQLTHIRWDQGAGSLGDINLLCYLFNFAVTLRVRLERVEVQCFDWSRVDNRSFTDAISTALILLGNPETGPRFKTHTVAIGFHGLLENVSAKDFVAKFVFQRTENLGAHVGSGIVFYYGAQDSRLSSAVTFDLSAVVKDGLFLRVQSVWDAQKVSAQELPTAVTNHLSTVLTNFGVQWSQR